MNISVINKVHGWKYILPSYIHLRLNHVSWTREHTGILGWLGRKEGNVLFNDTLNTFYLRLYCIRCIVKNHSDRPHRLLFPINSKGYFICTIPQTLLHQSWGTGWNEK